MEKVSFEPEVEERCDGRKKGDKEDDKLVCEMR